MTLGTRDASRSDYDAILRLNESAIPNVNRISPSELSDLHAQSFSLRVVSDRASLAGFLLTLRENASYPSLNFQWFKARYPEFVYIDRIVVAADFQRHGIGRLLYEDLINSAARVAPVLACEVNIEPPNPGSMKFHRSFGFVEVGQQDTEGGKKRVSLKILDLRA